MAIGHDKLTPEGKRFYAAIKEIAGMEVRVGFQAGEAEHEGVDICEIAAFNELGTANIPSRPFLRNSVDTNMDKISGNLEIWCNGVLYGEMQAHELMTNMGMLMKGLIQEEIVKGNFAPNSPATIQKKGSDKPLIDTGTMRESVNYQIVERGSYDD